MKTKILFLAMLFFSACLAEAQITPSMTIPNPIPNYDGSYDDFGQGELYYPNGGEIRFAEDQEDANEVVKYYTMNTYPKRFLMANNNISLCFAKTSTITTVADSIHRIDLEWKNSKTNAFLARVDTQNTGRLNYFTEWFSSAGRTDVRGGAAIACQSIYQNIDLVYTSNNAGLVMYFIVYPGGNYKDIVMEVKGAKANSIVSGKLKMDVNWESTTFEKPDMYQYSISSGIITPVNLANATWQSAGTNKYQLNTTSTFNTSLPLIVQIKQANAVQATSIQGLNWSTYFGGSGFEFLSKTHCDANDNLYVAGYSNSMLYFPQVQGVVPVPNSNGDGVIAKINSVGVLQWSTFIGGSSSDEIHDFDFNGNSIYCVGKTASSNLQTEAKTGATNDATFGGPAWDGFIFEFEFVPSSNSFQNNWLTYFGGNGDEELNACKFDASGNFFVVGDGASTSMTATGPGGSYQQSFNSAQLSSTPNAPLSTDALIAKFNTSSLQTWFTFFGTDALGTNAHSNAGDYFYGIAINGTDLYACGKAGGTNLPNSINSKVVSGNFDGILAHFTTSGALNNTKFTNGNISNYAVKELLSGIYTVGEANTSMNPVNSGLYFYDSSVSGTTDACFSVHSQNLSSTIHNSFLGGSDDDAAYDIQFTTNNLIVIAGGTKSSDFPVTSLGTMYSSNAKGINDNFLACLQYGNTNVTWSSYLGSDFNESLQYPLYFNSQTNIANTTIALNSQNYLHVLGSTTSNNTFPLDPWTGAPVYFQPQKNSFLANDGTITRLDMANLNTIVGLNDFTNTEFVFGVYPSPTVNNISITNYCDGK